MFGLNKLNKNQVLTAVAVFMALVAFGTVTFLAGGVNLDNTRQVDGLLSLVKEVVIWISVLIAFSTVAMIALREGPAAADKALKDTVVTLETSNLFDQMDESFDKLPEATKKAVLKANALLTSLNAGLLHSDGLEALSDMVNDLADIEKKTI
jgi:hypothetical protein